MNCSHIDILNVLEEPDADRLQSVLWPLVEPVDRCAVDYCWELPAANPQFAANWRKTQSHLQYMHTHIQRDRRAHWGQIKSSVKSNTVDQIHFASFWLESQRALLLRLILHGQERERNTVNSLSAVPSLNTQSLQQRCGLNNMLSCGLRQTDIHCWKWTAGLLRSSARCSMH